MKEMFDLPIRQQAPPDTNPFKRAADAWKLRSAVEKHRNESTFTCFPKLPKELQLKIWKYSLPGQRIVKFLHRGQGVATRPSTLYAPRRDQAFHIKFPEVSTLNVSVESRQLASKFYACRELMYKLGPKCEYDYNSGRCSCFGTFSWVRIPFDSQIDTLLLGSTTLLSSGLRAFGLRKLAVILSSSTNPFSLDSPETMTSTIGMLLISVHDSAPKLETLQLIVGSAPFSDSFEEELHIVEYGADFKKVLAVTLPEICPPSLAPWVFSLRHRLSDLSDHIIGLRQKEWKTWKGFIDMNIQVCVLAGQKKNKEKFDGLWFIRRPDGFSDKHGPSSLAIGYRNVDKDDKIIFLGSESVEDE